MAGKFTKQDCVEARDKLRAEVGAITALLEEKQETLAAFERILRNFFKDDVDNLPADASADSSQRFVGLSNSEAILRFLQEKPDTFFTPGEIKRALLAGGVTSNSARFDTVVMNECRRLVQRGQVVIMNDYGNFLYRLKQPGDEPL